ncbi:hypothetical protein Tco_1102633 [Tanacetum coccineum]
MCDNEGTADQNTEAHEDERVLLASLIANLKLDFDENKKSQKQLKKANTSLTQELEKSKQDLEISKEDLSYCKSELENFVYPWYLKKAQLEKPCLYNVKYDKNDLANLFAPKSDETIRLVEESRSKLCKAKIEYLPTKASMIKSKQVFDYLMINIENIRSVVELNWKNRLQNEWKNPVTHNVKLLVKDMLIPLARDTKSNASLFETHLKTEIFAYLKYVQSLEKEVDELQSYKTELSKEYDILLRECVSKDIMCAILHSFDNINEQTEMQCLYLEKLQECECKPTPFSNSLEKKDFSKTKSVTRTNVTHDLSKPVTPQILPQNRKQAVRNMNVIEPGMYRINTRPTQTRTPQLPQTFRNTNSHVSTSTGVIHKTSVSRPQLRSTQMKEKVVQNNSQVNIKKTEVEDHHRISSFSNKTKSVTACNDSLKSKTSNVSVVCVTCNKCVFNSNHDACVSKFINDVNARTNKPKALPISTRKPIRQSNQTVATPHKKIIASESTIQKSRSYFRMLYEKTSKT